MATTDELLASAESDSESEFEYIVIDADERTFTIPTTESLFGVYMDNTVERKYFLCPRYVDNEKIDVLGCTVKVNYVSSGGNLGTYICDDVAEYEDDPDYVSFSWLLDKAVFDGNTDTTISFAVQATDGENTFDTRIGTGNSYKTVETESLYTTYATLLLQILAMIDPDIDATDDDAIIAGIQAIIDTAEESTTSSADTIIEQLNLLIEGFGGTLEVVPDGYADVTSVTATDSDVLSGKVFVNSSGTETSGTMTNNGSVTGTISEVTEEHTIAKGYHDGTGTVSIDADEQAKIIASNIKRGVEILGVTGTYSDAGGSVSLQSKTVTPTKTSQTVTADAAYDALSDVTVEAIPDEYADITGVTATAGDVLAEKTFIDSTGTETSGTMTNNGAIAGTIDGINTTSYTIPEGYHDGSGTVSLTDDIDTTLTEIATLIGGDA